ncbi:Uncharacterised protein [Photobacterium damselae]|uniref:Uncharacterized protein n=1 Tax=Photobacterium damselae TaxID=38293 RepID=A0A2X1W052_PHODM|nr:Uncharacterised protein [Photobacterium damselae]SPY27980.1 Uncharacterised protein [Photobacterium damselae]SUB66538.1 Uncharacterised protein [Photobacterium damselae]
MEKKPDKHLWMIPTGVSLLLAVLGFVILHPMIN